jgi:hypothetical protein
LRRLGLDLVLELGQSDQITLTNWYRGTGNRNVVNLQVVNDASAGFDPTATDPLRDNRIEQFNFIGLVERFDQEAKANPALSRWSLANAMLDFHVAGSDTAALGGDLAYQYGHGGGLTGIGITPAQAILNDTRFGSAPQNLQTVADLHTGNLRLG